MKAKYRTSQLLKKPPQTVWKSKTQTKYRVVAEGLRELIARLAPGAKLPPTRELTGQFGVTMVTLLRALRELSAEGLVVARRGAGYWVAPRKQTTRPGLGFAGRQTTELRCKVQSALPHQMAYWKEAAQAYAKVYPGSDITFVPMDGGAPPDVSDADLIEISTLQYPEVLESGCLLHEPGDERTQSRVFFSTQQAHLSCAFYNPVLLAKIGAPAPDYEDFEGQMRWLLDLQAKWKKATGNAQPFINTHESYLLLGEKGREALMDWLKGKEAALPPRLDERLRRIHAMWSLAVKPGAHDWPATLEAMFNNGEIPVVFARTSGLRDVFLVNDFEPGCHPCFDTDDEIASVETGFVVRRDHGRAADALRFAEFLAKPEMQRLLPEHEMVPLRADLFTAGDAPSLWKKSRTAWFRTSEEKSIWHSIVGCEWWRWQRGEIDFATFQTDCRHLARMTLFQG
jgi:DNA-binding transcriptional regulator YhcF (GntR family)